MKIKVFLNGKEIQELRLEEGQEYIIGRQATSAIALGDYPGISRQHLRITEADGQWTVQVISKFGQMHHHGEQISSLNLGQDESFELTPYVFKVLTEDSVVHESQIHVEPMASISHLPVPTLGSSPMLTANGAAAFQQDETDNEPTFAEQILGVPYIRIQSSRAAEELLRLDGEQWVAGREENCQIFLNDLKSSRRQFELIAKNGFFVRDLGSSNGTLLNGQLLPAHEMVAIKSGDVISVAELLVHFELRDPNFENKLTVIPADMLKEPAFDNPGIFGNDPQYNGANLPALQGAGGVIRLDQQNPGQMAPYDPNLYGYQQQQWNGYQQPAPKPQKKSPVFFIAVALLFIAVVYFVSSDNSHTQPKPRVSTNPGFDQLSDANKQLIKQTYDLAKSFSLQNNHNSAATQLQKLHEILPTGYLDSLKMAEDSNAAIETQKRVNEITQDQERIHLLQKELQQILTDCEKVAARTNLENEIRTCLSRAYEIDPENVQVSEMVNRVRQRSEQLKLNAQARNELQERIHKGEALYHHATTLEKQGDLLVAITAYEKHVASEYPDPGGLKAKSKAAIVSVRQEINEKVEKALADAKKIGNEGGVKVREAVALLEKAKKIDPDNEKIHTLFNKYVHDLNTQMQNIYSESVVEEGTGLVDSAQEKWRKILEIDRPDGDYARKARSKLRSYGGE